MSRDSQRSKVYDWEKALGAAFDVQIFGETLSLEQAQAMAERIVRAYSDYGSVRVVSGAAHRRRGVAVGRSLIKLPSFARNPLYVCHEVAHTLNVGDGHGPRFMRTYLDLIRKHVPAVPIREARRLATDRRIRVAKREAARRPLRTYRAPKFALAAGRLKENATGG